MRGNGFKVKEGRYILAIKNKLLTVRVVRPWDRMPREAVGIPSPEESKARSDEAGSNLALWKVSLHRARVVGT